MTYNDSNNFDLELKDQESFFNRRSLEKGYLEVPLSGVLSVQKQNK